MFYLGRSALYFVSKMSPHSQWFTPHKLFLSCDYYEESCSTIYNATSVKSLLRSWQSLSEIRVYISRRNGRIRGTIYTKTAGFFYNRPLIFQENIHHYTLSDSVITNMHLYRLKQNLQACKPVGSFFACETCGYYSRTIKPTAIN